MEWADLRCWRTCWTDTTRYTSPLLPYSPLSFCKIIELLFLIQHHAENIVVTHFVGSSRASSNCGGLIQCVMCELLVYVRDGSTNVSYDTQAAIGNHFSSLSVFCLFSFQFLMFRCRRVSEVLRGDACEEQEKRDWKLITEKTLLATSCYNCLAADEDCILHSPFTFPPPPSPSFLFWFIVFCFWVKQLFAQKGGGTQGLVVALHCHWGLDLPPPRPHQLIKQR